MNQMSLLFTNIEPTTKVVNMKVTSRYDVCIDRTTKWGNPFVISKDSARSEVLKEYKKYLWNQIECGKIIREELLALDGKILGCWCKPKACHGDILIEAINWAKEHK